VKNIEILIGGNVINTILASEQFAEQAYPGAWRLAAVQPVVPVAAPDPRLWHIDVGPFKDRLGMDALAIAASDHGACRAVIEMLNGRKFVSLTDPKTASLMDILIATSQPTANPMFPGSGPLTAAKKLAILTTETTEEERHVKGLA
jgi:hypothetical protein